MGDQFGHPQGVQVKNFKFSIHLPPPLDRSASPMVFIRPGTRRIRDLPRAMSAQVIQRSLGSGAGAMAAKTVQILNCQWMDRAGHILMLREDGTDRLLCSSCAVR